MDGTYTISPLNPSVVVIRDSGYTRVQTLMVHNSSAKASHQTTIAFDLVGGQYFLRRIQLAESATGVECAKSHAEKKAEVETATLRQNPPTVVALNTLPY
jgi:hypothetical protein